MLQNRNYVVTGAARGIGLGITTAILDAGGSVVLTDLDPVALEKTRQSVVTEYGDNNDNICVQEMDVACEESVAEAFSAAQARLGEIHGLVNNAGVIRMGAELETPAQDWEFQYRVNVIGMHNCCRVFALHLQASGRPGAIVNIASNAGKAGYPNMAAYNASKAAVISLTRSLAAEWAEFAINVNAVCPGGVRTPMLEEVARQVGQRIGAGADELIDSMVPAQMGRHIKPREIGRVVVFLLSDDAKIIRGQSINTDGGDTPY